MDGAGEAAEATVTVRLSRDAYEAFEEIASTLGVTVEEAASKLLDVVATYKGVLAELSSKLRVKKEHMPDSVFEELVYYGVEAWRGVLEPLLWRLKAVGRFELETLELDPEDGSLEVELIALEGSDLKADVVRLNWNPKGVVMEVYYYLDEGVEPPRELRVSGGDWAYLPDEHAVMVTFQAKRLTDLPPIHAVDRMVEPYI